MRWYRTAVVTALALAVGCANTRVPGPEPANVTAPEPSPARVADPAHPSPLEPVPDCDPLASYRPTGPPPPPGQMPAGTWMREIQDRGYLIVGVNQSTYPFGYRDVPTGELSGFDISVAHEMAKAIFGDPDAIHFQVVTTKQSIPAVAGGDVDMVVRTLSMSCRRWLEVAFSASYYSTNQRVLVPLNSPIEGLSGLVGKRVCATKTSTSVEHIAMLVPDPRPVAPIPVAADAWTDCLLMLEQGQVDAISTDATILAGLRAQSPNTKIIGEPIHDEPYGIAISKDHTDLVRFVNSVLERMRTDGTWLRFYDESLADLSPELVGPPVPPEPVYREEP